MLANRENIAPAPAKSTASARLARAFRFLLLALATLAVFSAQYLLRDAELSALGWEPLQRLSSFYAANFYSSATAWLLAVRVQAIIGLTAAGVVLFGIAAPAWPGNLPRLAGPVPPTLAARRPSPAATALILLGLAGGLGVGIFLAEGNRETVEVQIVWGLALLAYAIGCFVSVPARQPADNTGRAHPSSTWPLFLLIFLAALGLFGWQLGSVPLRVDGETAAHGLQALEILAGQESRIFARDGFATDRASLPLLAYYPAALGMLTSGDLLLGNRLPGLVAGLLTLLGVWLLGGELFRRPAAPAPPNRYSMDGGFVALLAAVFLAISHVFLHFSRLPRFIEPVPWGIFALWAIHRGVRQGQRGALGLGGLLLGLAVVLFEGGVVFLPVALFWWAGLLLARRRWLSPANGVGLAGFGLWLGGFATFLAPFVGVWLRDGAPLLAGLRARTLWNPAAQAHLAGVYGTNDFNEILWQNLGRTLGAFQIFSDTSSLFGYQLPLLDWLTGPLLLLGLGFLLLNLDRLQSWLLLGWLLIGLAVGGVVTVNTPYWPYLLPVLPVAFLVAAGAVERWRALAYEMGGAWLRGLVTSIVVGLVVLVGLLNWVRYYELMTVYGDPATYTGRALRQLDRSRIPYLVETGESDRVGWEERVVFFLAGGDYFFRQRGELDTAEWPQRLPPASTVLLHPADRELAAALEARYPGGVYWVQRNRQGNPILFLYHLP